MLDRTITIEKYWTSVVRNTAEFQQIAFTENPELNNLLGCINRILQDAFINDATEYGVSRWEAILGIHPSPDATLEERKIAILTYLSVRRPYTMRVLENILVATLGEDNFELNLVNDTQTLLVTILDEAKTNEVLYLVKRVIPQNLDLIVLHKQVIDVIHVGETPQDGRYHTWSWIQLDERHSRDAQLESLTLHVPGGNFTPGNTNIVYLEYWQLVNKVWEVKACSVNGHAMRTGAELVFKFPKGTMMHLGRRMRFCLTLIEGDMTWRDSVFFTTMTTTSTDNTRINTYSGQVRVSPYVTITSTKQLTSGGELE